MPHRPIVYTIGVTSLPFLAKELQMNGGEQSRMLLRTRYLAGTMSKELHHSYITTTPLSNGLPQALPTPLVFHNFITGYFSSICHRQIQLSLAPSFLYRKLRTMWVGKSKHHSKPPQVALLTALPLLSGLTNWIKLDTTFALSGIIPSIGISPKTAWLPLLEMIPWPGFWFNAKQIRQMHEQS